MRSPILSYPILSSPLLLTGFWKGGSAEPHMTLWKEAGKSMTTMAMQHGSFADSYRLNVRLLHPPEPQPFAHAAPTAAFAHPYTALSVLG